MAEGLKPGSDEAIESRYKKLRRNILFLMLLMSLVPLTIMAVINYNEYRRTLRGEIVEPLRGLASKAAHSLDLYLDERLSAIRFLAYAYSLEELSKESNLKHVFWALSSQYKGFIDLGLIDENGIQIGYCGPYKLEGKNYSDQAWFHEVVVRGVYVSDVFLGYRRFPHVAIAVKRLEEDGSFWIVRTTIDTKRFEDVIHSMGLDPSSDAFLVNSKGILQTSSRLYGKVLGECPLVISLSAVGTQVIEAKGPKGEELLVAYAQLSHADYMLLVVRPGASVLRSWYSLKREMLVVFLLGILGIIVASLRLTNLMVKRIQAADIRREATFRELQHSQKLSSIGRLAAGVAHEINNPMAIINEKAGLMKDLMETSGEFGYKEKFSTLLDDILKAVDRTKTITHRLLGFAKRMDVRFEELQINDVVKEVLGFLEKEALYKNVEIRLQLDENLPRIYSDRGQLQQVFLNLLTNALEAVEEEGFITITSWQDGPDKVAVSVQDNGRGMSKETMEHIFEPFFTTKREYGTGLGLSITYGIVKKLGGDIHVASQESVGTTFTVFLPLKSEATMEG
ncbi:MAG: GHKL domain-containing protein [Deltaproteobacteria bacterium]|nr:GHKL domain-containing protein [Deltaproteobacteria bacterium]MBW1930109.1 GHKL domain-containing protein [Deltaproteobacteria bacterium]MBW2027047.1 GHKL domain-containing protein [Deltaproteobacteria bacterium]MBW2127055.1 GHKL domain-containing protein [Deltaproteobacteria bacterium]